MGNAQTGTGAVGGQCEPKSASNKRRKLQSTAVKYS